MKRQYLSILTALLSQTLCAQEKDLTTLTLEDFMNLKVTSVEKSPHKLSRTAAAVFVITQDDIRRSGATSLPEVLRLAPGVNVARIGGYRWAVSIRGFNTIYSNKLLVMIDGRTIYNAIFSGVLWSENQVMLEDVDRIEVIRGPGATMWGANAVSGVINIITKSARETTGGLAAVSGGNIDRVRTRVRYGAPIGRAAAWRAWAQYVQLDERGFSLPRLDNWNAVRGGMRIDWQPGPRDELLVEGEVQKSNPIEMQMLDDTLGSVTNRAAEKGGTSSYLMGRWTHITSGGHELTLQAFGDDNRISTGIFDSRVRVLDFDFQNTLRATPRHALIFGGGARSNLIEVAGTPVVFFVPANRTYYTFNTFVEDDWVLRPDKLSLSVGAKAEHYTLAGFALQPTARLMWTPTPRQGYWISASRAVRTPAHTDYAVRLRIAIPGLPIPIELMGSDRFKPEAVTAIEGGARFQIRRRWGLDIAAFRHSYSGLHSYRMGAPILFGADPAAQESVVIPAVTTNGLDGLNQGVEAVVHYDVRRGLRLSGSYSALFATTSYRQGLYAGNAFSFSDYTPEHQWYLRSAWDFARNWTADAVFYRTGELPGGVLPPYSRLDCRIARKFGEFAELSVGGQNLLRPFHREFVDNGSFPSALVYRNIGIEVRWHF